MQRLSLLDHARSEACRRPASQNAIQPGDAGIRLCHMMKAAVLPATRVISAVDRARFNCPTVVASCLVIGLSACGGDADIDPSVAAAPTGSLAALPEPVFVWPLDGDGVALVGDADLEFSGGHDLGTDAVALDGVTGSANSLESGLIDTTQSFSVAAWVSLDHPDEYATVVSQIGEVAAAFYLGYAEGRWSFNMKSADGPGGNAHAKAPNSPNDPAAAWVHLVGVYDDSAGQIRLHIDGERVAEAAFNAEWQASGPLTVGRTQADGAPANFWPGAIAEVRVYVAALDDAQVAAIGTAGRPSSPPPPLAEIPEGFHCADGGGLCLGPLAAGTYTTQIFQPTITYTVPEGWTNAEDLLGNFLLQVEGASRYIGIYRNVGVPVACLEEVDLDVGLTVNELSKWYTSHPGLVTSEPQPTSVGGLEGVVIDVALDPSWTEPCGWSGGQPSVGILAGAGPSSLTHVLLPSRNEERLYLLELGDGNVTVEIGPEGTPLDQFLEDVAPIIESLRFGS